MAAGGAEAAEIEGRPLVGLGETLQHRNWEELREGKDRTVMTSRLGKGLWEFLVWGCWGASCGGAHLALSL